MPPYPVHTSVLVTPLTDADDCDLRPGGPAPLGLQSQPCGVFADWAVTLPAPHGQAHGGERGETLRACGRHLAAAVRHISAAGDRQEAGR